MGQNCTKRTIDAIPDRAVMENIIERIVQFEQLLKKGESLTRVEEKEKRDLDAVARAMSKVQRKEKTLVRGVHVQVDK